MQTMWRLPWSSEPGGDKTVADKVAMQKSKQIPVVEMPLFNKLKRKQTNSLEPASPQNARLPKKLKSAQSEARPVSYIAPAAMPTATLPSPPANQANGQAETTVSAVTKKSPQEELPPVHDVRKEKGPERTPSTSQTQAQVRQPRDNTQQTASAATANLTMTDNLSSLQQVIASHFSLEILLKHNELRFIEQELAKCQIALEQLRRCQLVPYPGTNGPSDLVSSGVGPSLEPRRGNSVAQSPAPWGVTDGPYTRHYAKWLISDPKFDSAPVQTVATIPAGLPEGRATRGSVADSVMGSRSRASRASAVQGSLDATSSNGCRDPLVLKRSTDGQWVRLFCDICNRGDFSNVQGFLNHCRIAHSQRFETHDAAAIKCGRPVDSNELPALLAAQPVAMPTSAVSIGPLVHPLIKPAPLSRPHVPLQRLSMPKPDPSKPSGVPLLAAASAKASFVPSSQTPYLSAELQKRGFSGNLGKMVDDARTKVDLDSMRSSDDDEGDSTVENHHSSDRAQTMKLQSMPTNSQHARAGGMAPAPLDRPVSRKAHRPETPRPSLHLLQMPPRSHGLSFTPESLRQSITPISAFSGSSQPPSLLAASSTIVDKRTEVPESPMEMELSPHTVESNPGLISDHDDDDDEDDAPSEAVAVADGERAHRVVHQNDEDYGMDDVMEVDDASDVEKMKGVQGFEAGSSRKG